ncbi:baseplate assembly protein W [Pasteurellaceae bacterium Macca]|nr:baseplate assembly protein W [Pasteurellaceae bacterium Macca]
MNRHNGTTLDDSQHLRQSISDILLTPIGTRIQRREYGSYLFELIDRPQSHALALQIAAASVMALKKWEPRISVTAFNVHLAPHSPHQITADLLGIYQENQQQVRLDKLVIA